MGGQFWHEKAETMSAGQISEKQFSDMRNIVSFAHSRSLFYRALYGHIGFEPGDIAAWDDFRRLPTIRREDIRRDLTENPIFGNILAVNEYDVVYVSTSSGTSGLPMISPFSREEFNDIVALSARFFYGQGLRCTDRYIHCLNLSLFVASPSVLSAQEIGASTIWAGILPAERLSHLIRQIGITAMLTTPSFAGKLGTHLNESGIFCKDDSRMGLIILAGEPGGSIPSTREAIRNLWGDVKIGEVYGFSEVMGCIAGSCPVHEGLHVAEDYFLVEILKTDSDEPVPDGKPGEITITALRKKTRPMIRYRSGDIGFIDRRPCACGRTHARVTVKGRLDDMFIVSGVNIFPSDLEQVIRKCPGITGEYLIRLTNDCFSTAYDLELEREANSDEPPEAIGERVTRELKNAVLAKPRSVIVHERATLPRSDFKTKRIIDDRTNGGNAFE